MPGANAVGAANWRSPAFEPPGLYCAPTQISLKIDEHVIPSPVKESVKIAELDLTSRHRVTVFRDHKPQQSFVFRFSDLKSKQLCLFLNSLYMTAQLWEAKRALGVNANNLK
jgi:hypothetical protein